MLGSGPLYLLAIPLSDNPFLPLTTEKRVQTTLTKLGLDTFGSLFPDGQARKLSDMIQLPGMTCMDNFTMTRLLGTLRTVFTTFPAVYAEFVPLTLLITDDSGAHLITKLFKACILLKKVRDRGT